MFLAAALGYMLFAASPHRGFLDITERSKINFQHAANKTAEKFLPEAMGSGVALFDYNNDGLLDVFFVNSTAWNRLYRNNGDGSFTDVTEAAGLQGRGYRMGAAVGDFNNDGWQDLYVTAVGGNTLYRNNGDGTFTDITAKSGAGGSGWSVSAAFVDYDRDGNLDLVVTRYLDWDASKNRYCGDRKPGYRSYCHPDLFPPTTALVFHNNGNGSFTDVSKTSGLGSVPGKGLGIAVNDFDDDGWPDIVIANDSAPEQLFHNQRDGTFKEVAVELGLAYDEDGKTYAGMGVDVADYDNDGFPDIFINALANQRYALYRNLRGKAFNYVSPATGVAAITANHSGWGAKFFDYDNDGWKDLFVAQGHVMDNIELTEPAARYREKLLLLRNQRGKFTDVSARGGPAFQIPLAARGAAFGDLNNDGSIDVVINCNAGPAVILQNQGGNGHHWLMVNLVGRRSNRDGQGARIRIQTPAGLEQRGYATTAGSYASASDKRVHFGLGTEQIVKLLEIQWPAGGTQILRNLTADQILTIKEE